MLRRAAGEIEGYPRDAFDFEGRVNGRVDGPLLATLERHDFLGLAEISAARQFAQDQDVQALDVLALEGRGLRQRRVADGGAQIGEQIEVLAQAQQARFGTNRISHLVPFGPADGTEYNGVRRTRQAQSLIRQRHAVLVDGGPTDQRRRGVEAHLPLLVEEGNEALDLGHHLRADAVAGKQQE